MLSKFFINKILEIYDNNNWYSEDLEEFLLYTVDNIKFNYFSSFIIYDLIKSIYEWNTQGLEFNVPIDDFVLSDKIIAENNLYNSWILDYITKLEIYSPNWLNKNAKRKY